MDLITSTSEVIVPDWTKENILDTSHPAGPAWPVKVALFSRAPLLVTGSLADKVSVDELLEDPWWVPASATVTAKFDGSVQSSLAILVEEHGGVECVILTTMGAEGGTPSDVVTLDGSSVDGWYISPNTGLPHNGQEVITTAVVYIDMEDFGGSGADRPILAIFTKGIGTATTVREGSVLGIAREEDGVAKLFQQVGPTEDNRWAAGRIMVQTPPAEWEAANALHLWVEPQRANLVANPMVRGESYWNVAASAGTPSIDAGLVSSDFGGPHNLVIESNLFPSTSQWLSVRFTASGGGTLRFGINFWSSDYSTPEFLGFDVEHQLVEGETVFTRHFPAPTDATEAQLRIEVDGTEGVVLTKVLVDPNPSSFEYFDGDSIDGGTLDYGWHGEQANAQMSVWYNNFLPTISRLFGGTDTTDAIEAARGFRSGMLGEWVPTGASVVLHHDTLGTLRPNNWVGPSYYPIRDNWGLSVATRP